jgi:hypothetical protein
MTKRARKKEIERVCDSWRENERETIKQGWPDFLSHGPFSIILNVLEAASSLMFH